MFHRINLSGNIDIVCGSRSQAKEKELTSAIPFQAEKPLWKYGMRNRQTK